MHFNRETRRRGRAQIPCLEVRRKSKTRYGKFCGQGSSEAFTSLTLINRSGRLPRKTRSYLPPYNLIVLNTYNGKSCIVLDEGFRSPGNGCRDNPLGRLSLVSPRTRLSAAAACLRGLMEGLVTNYCLQSP